MGLAVPRANQVWLNDGNGNFTDSGQSLGNSRSNAVSLGDVDGDGDLDAFVGNSLRCVQDTCGPAPNAVWLSDGSGSFSASGQSLGGAFSLAVAVGDLDGDGDLDTLVGNEGANTVWLNQDPRPGDFDDDQDIDGDDFLIWQDGFGIQSRATRHNGDADFDGDVDGDDFVIWQTNFDAGATTGNASAVPAVRRRDSDHLDSSMSRKEVLDEAYVERDGASARWTKRSLRDELVDELTLLK